MHRKLAYSSIFILSVFLPIAVFAYTSPGRPTGFVNDFANVISVNERATIETKLQSLEKSTGIQVAVATVPSLGDETIESYAVALFQDWGIGRKGKDNGLLILVAPVDREARIEIGYGLEGTVTDLQAGNIVDKIMIPAFKTGDYAAGISGAVDAVSGIIAKDPTIIATYSGDQSSGSGMQSADWQKNIFAFFFLGVIVLNMLARILGRTKSWWLGGVIGAIIGLIIGFIWGFVYIGIGWIIGLTILGLIFDYFVSKHPPKSGGKGGGFWPIIFFGGRGGRGGLGGGGGFGGFGGGMSGGGGASGRW